MFLERKVTDFSNDDFIQYTEKKEKRESKNLALSLAVQITFYVLLIFFAIFFIWYTAFISTHKYYRVYGASMKNSLNSQLKVDDGVGSDDAVYVDEKGKVKLYDIVVAKREGKKDPVIKRVMAFEGDYISVAVHKDEEGDDNLYFYRIASGTDLSDFDEETARVDESSGVNGYTIYSYGDWLFNKDCTTFLSEENLDASSLNTHYYEDDFFATYLDGHLEEILQGSDDFFVSKSGLVFVKVPEGKYFCMGDNRGHSVDSRENGFYDFDKIIGRVEIVIYDYNFGRRLGGVIKYYFTQIGKFFAR